MTEKNRPKKCGKTVEFLIISVVAIKWDKGYTIE